MTENNTKDPQDLVLKLAVVTVLILSILLGVLLAVSKKTYLPDIDTDVPFAESGEEDPSEIYYRKRAGYCFLVAGVDNVADLTDTMAVVSISREGKINVLQLPRDTYVCYRGTERKLNSLYALGGIETLRSVVETALCINIDFTVTIGTDAFAAAVDAVGGVEIDVPIDMDYEDPEQNLYIHIKAGLQTLDGKNAEGFVRYRSGYSGGDLDRMDAQKKFIAAYLKTLRSNIKPKTISKFITELFPLIDTDMEIDDCVWFATKVIEGGYGGSSGLTMYTLPGRSLYSTELKSSFYVIGRAAVLELVNSDFSDYGEPITDDLFDKKRIFVREGDDEFIKIYTYSIINTKKVEG